MNQVDPVLLGADLSRTLKQLIFNFTHPSAQRLDLIIILCGQIQAENKTNCDKY